jgi:leader peptidase (prepilin peptidase)/N-methyltransferase
MRTMLPYLVAGLLGAFLGSFLNVCIHRLPRRESVVWPGSRCPACGAGIRPRDNIPLLSYVLLGGRCRACRTRISLRYPLIEATNASGYVVILWWFGLGWPSAVYALWFSALLVIAVIDLSHQIIPNVITLPAVAIGFLAAATVLPVGGADSLLGILLGYGLPWALAALYRAVRGREGLGLGDAKLLAMVGAVLGWKPVLLTILVGALVGSVVGLTLIGFRLLPPDEYLPFGPFLALGALVALFFQDDLLAWYFGAVLGAR